MPFTRSWLFMKPPTSLLCLRESTMRSRRIANVTRQNRPSTLCNYFALNFDFINKWEFFPQMGEAFEQRIKPTSLGVKFGAGGKCAGTFKRTKEVVLALIIQSAVCSLRLDLHATNRIGDVGIR